MLAGNLSIYLNYSKDLTTIIVSNGAVMFIVYTNILIQVTFKGYIQIKETKRNPNLELGPSEEND